MRLQIDTDVRESLRRNCQGTRNKFAAGTCTRPDRTPWREKWGFLIKREFDHVWNNDDNTTTIAMARNGNGRNTHLMSWDCHWQRLVVCEFVGSFVRLFLVRICCLDLVLSSGLWKKKNMWARKGKKNQEPNSAHQVSNRHRVKKNFCRIATTSTKRSTRRTFDTSETEGKRRESCFVFCCYNLIVDPLFLYKICSR